MNKLSKNISKVVAIVTGLGMNFGTYNPQAMMENVINVNTQEVDFQPVSDFVKENKEKLGLIKVVEDTLSGSYCYVFDNGGNLLIYDNKNKTVKLSNKTEDIGCPDEMEVFIKFPSDKIDLSEDNELNGGKKKMWIIDQKTSYLRSLKNKGEEGKKELEKIRLKEKIKIQKMLVLGTKIKAPIYQSENQKECEKTGKNDSSDWLFWSCVGIAPIYLYIYFGYILPYGLQLLEED